MELKDRIQQIMNREKVSASVFADSIGVQRSSISHILSGRNKPSLEFVQKILISYPKYKAEWLIMGIGDIDSLNTLNPSNNTASISKTATNKNLFNEPFVTNLQKETIINEPIKHESDEKDSYTNKGEAKEFFSHKSPVETLNNTHKPIDKIVIFYSDKSFEVYNPNKNE